MKILLAIVATVLMFAGCSREVEEAVAASDCCSFYKKEKTLPRDVRSSVSTPLVLGLLYFADLSVSAMMAAEGRLLKPSIAPFTWHLLNV